MKLSEFLSKDPSEIAKKELLIFHLRLHQWYGDGKGLDDETARQIIKAHTLVWFEFVRRSLRHKCISDLDRQRDEKVFGEEWSNYYTAFVEGVASKIPQNGECSGSQKNKLENLHTSIHSLWNLAFRCSGAKPTEDFLNAHNLIVNYLVKNCKWNHPKWDHLDTAELGKTFFYSTNSDKKPRGVLLLFEFLERIPDFIEIQPSFAQLDLKNKRIKIEKKFGSKLVQVIYFRLLRYLNPRDWQFKIVTEIEEPDVSFDLRLRRISPFTTVHLNLSPVMFSREVILSSPFLFLVGGLATRGFTSGDIDLLLRSGLESEKEVRSIIQQELGDDRINFVSDDGFAPYTSYVGLMDLVLTRRGEVVQINFERQEES